MGRARDTACVGPLIGISQNLSESLRLSQILSDSLRISQTLSDSLRISQNLSALLRVLTPIYDPSQILSDSLGSGLGDQSDRTQSDLADPRGRTQSDFRNKSLDRGFDERPMDFL